MSVWPQLAKTALLGTKREPLPTFGAAKVPLNRILNEVHGDSPELSLLLKAGVMTMYEQNGRLPEQQHARLPNTPPTNTRSPAPPDAARFLNDLIYGQHVSQLREFLEALDHAGYIVPRQYLPNLLDKGSKTANIRAALYPVIGETGRWLAVQNPAWHYAADDIYHWKGALRSWSNGSAVKRVALLNQLRERSPETARQLLDMHWRSVPDLLRHKLIHTLTVNISMADEPFLETALDDRNHLVRKKAAELLAYLPESRFGKRMAQYALQFMSWERDKLVVHFPKEITPQMVRDGLPGSHPKMSHTRFRTQQLSYVIAGTPLETWTTAWGVPIHKIVNQLGASKWPRTILSGLTTAARRQKNQPWIEHLLIGQSFNTSVASLIKVVDPAALQKFILENRDLFAAGRLLIQRDHPMRTVLYNFPHAWQDPLYKFWIEQFATYIRQTSDRSTVDPQIKQMLNRLLSNLPLSQMTYARETLKEAALVNEPWANPLESMFKTMAFRQAMLQAIFG